MAATINPDFNGVIPDHHVEDGCDVFTFSLSEGQGTTQTFSLEASRLGPFYPVNATRITTHSDGYEVASGPYGESDTIIRGGGG